MLRVIGVREVGNPFLSDVEVGLPYVSDLISIYSAQFRPTFMTRRGKKKHVVAVQTSPSTPISISTIHSELHRRRTDCDIIAPSSHPSRVFGCLYTVLWLSYEIFQEIFSNLTFLRWTEVYYRCQQDDVWSQSIPAIYWERARTLLALSASCKAMRQMVLMEAWENYIMCRMSWSVGYRTGAKFLSQCGVLLENPNLAAYVR